MSSPSLQPTVLLFFLPPTSLKPLLAVLTPHFFKWQLHYLHILTVLWLLKVTSSWHWPALIIQSSNSPLLLVSYVTAQQTSTQPGPLRHKCKHVNCIMCGYFREYTEYTPIFLCNPSTIWEICYPFYHKNTEYCSVFTYSEYFWCQRWRHSRIF